MGSYFNRGASAGGHDEGDFNRKDITGPSGTGGGARGGPGPVADENKGVGEYDPVQGIAQRDESIEEPASDFNHSEDSGSGYASEPEKRGVVLDETAGNDSPVRADESYGRIIEGSDSPRTGTSWSTQSYENAPTASTPKGDIPEREGRRDASPNRNTGDRLERDELNNVGSWSIIDNNDSAGSPSGNS